MHRRALLRLLATMSLGHGVTSLAMGAQAPAPGALQVGPHGRWFAAGGVPVDYREISAFSLYSRWLLGQREHVQGWAARAASHGATALRVFLTLDGPYWEAQPRHWFGHGLRCGPHVPGFADQLGPFVDAMLGRGLRLRLVLLGDVRMFVPPARVPDVDARRDALDDDARNRIAGFVRDTVASLAGRPGLLWEVANEYNNIGLASSDSFLVDLGRLIKKTDPDALMNLSAPRDGKDGAAQWFREPADFGSVHVSRDRGDQGYEWLTQLVSIAPLGSETTPRMPFMSGEPLNFGDARRDGRDGDVEPSPAIAFAYGAASRLLRVITTFHHDDGLWTAGWGARTERTLGAWKQGLDAVPLLATASSDAAAAASPWNADALPTLSRTRAADAGGPAIPAVISNGPYSLVLGVPAGWQPAAALKAGQQVDLVARVSDGTTESGVYRHRS